MRHRQPSRAVQGCRNLKVRLAEGPAPVVLLQGSNTRKPRALNAAASSPGTNFTSPKIVPSQHKPHARQMDSEAAALDFFEALNASHSTPSRAPLATHFNTFLNLLQVTELPPNYGEFITAANFCGEKAPAVADRISFRRMMRAPFEFGSEKGSPQEPAVV